MDNIIGIEAMRIRRRLVRLEREELIALVAGAGDRVNRARKARLDLERKYRKPRRGRNER